MNIPTITVQEFTRFWQHPKKARPVFSMEKIKKKLSEVYDAYHEVRKSSEENLKTQPRIHQSVQSTAWELVRYYIRHWGKANATNYELRITHSYLKQALNNSCCVATLKNHINKLLAMGEGFIKAKFRGGLGINPQNTPCIILVLNRDVMIFDDERYNQALAQDEIAAEEKKLAEAHKRRQATAAAQQMQILREDAKIQKNERNKTPTLIGNFLGKVLGGSVYRE